MSINPLSHHYAMENPASVYDEEAMTALQLAARTTGKVNEVVKAFNELEQGTEKRLDEIPAIVADDVQEHIDNGQFDKQVDKYAGNLKTHIESVDRSLSARMDGFTRMGAGSTTGDAELQDARISDLGTIFNNVGEHLRLTASLFREATAPAFVKEMGLYDLFDYYYVNGDVNGAEDCLALTKLVKFNTSVTIVPLYGYEISTQRYTENNRNYPDKYTGWTTEGTLLVPGKYYSIAVRHGTDKITRDEAYAVQFVTPFFTGEVYGNALDTIYPLMRMGGFTLASEDVYVEGDTGTMYSAGGFTLSQPAVLHCEGDASIAFHTFDGEISPETMTGDSGWMKELIIPANTFGVLYFRKSPSRPAVVLDDLKLIKAGHSLNVATDKGNINRAHITPARKGIAHRGYSNYGTFAPENTLPAFRQAKAMGFDYVECDVRITADDVPVVCHDTTIDRTSNGSGYVAEMTLEELKSFDFSEGCDIAKYKGTKMPTLEETLVTCKNLGLNLYIEVEPQCVGKESSIVELVKVYGMENAVTYISFSHEVLVNISKLDASAPLGYIVEKAGDGHINACLALRTGYNDVFLDARSIGADFVEACKRYGVPVERWTLDDVPTMQNLDPYVRGVTSEYTNYKSVMYEKEMEES